MVDLIIMGVTRTHGTASKKLIGLWRLGDVVGIYPGGTFVDPPHPNSPFIALRVSDGVFDDVSNLVAQKHHLTEKDRNGEAKSSGRRSKNFKKSFIKSLSRTEINVVTLADLSRKSRSKSRG